MRIFDSLITSKATANHDPHSIMPAGNAEYLAISLAYSFISITTESHGPDLDYFNSNWTQGSEISILSVSLSNYGAIHAHTCGHSMILLHQAKTFLNGALPKLTCRLESFPARKSSSIDLS